MQKPELTPLPEVKALPLGDANLYFAGWGYDERDDADNVTRGANVVVMEINEQTFVLRKIRDYVFFRRSGEKDERVAWFLREYCPNSCKYDIGLSLQEPNPEDWKDDIREFPPEKFVEAYARQAYGRCLLHVPPDAQRDEIGLVCLSPTNCDSFVLNRRGGLMVRFDFKSVMKMSWKKLLSTDSNILRPRFGMLLKMGRIVEQRDRGFPSVALPWVSHKFVSGSEAELRRLTTQIAHTDPELFATSTDPITVTYRAQTADKPARLLHVRRRDTSGRMEEHTAFLERLRYLCGLAIRHNVLTGEDWRTVFDYGDQCGRIVYFAAIYGSFKKEVAQVEYEVFPPSAHERAESLLSLNDWLESKVSEEERLSLLGMEDE